MKKTEGNLSHMRAHTRTHAHTHAHTHIQGESTCTTLALTTGGGEGEVMYECSEFGVHCSKAHGKDDLRLPLHPDIGQKET